MYPSIVSYLVICSIEKGIIIHDAECPYLDQVSLNNTCFLLQKLKDKLGSGGATPDDIGTWELSAESNVPYEELAEQTEAVNNLYLERHGNGQSVAGSEGGATSSDSNDNDILGVKVIPASEATGSFGSFAEPR